MIIRYLDPWGSILYFEPLSTIPKAPKEMSRDTHKLAEVFGKRRKESSKRFLNVIWALGRFLNLQGSWDRFKRPKWPI